MMVEGADQASSRGRVASRDLPTPAPTVRTLSPSVPCDHEHWVPPWPSPMSRRREKAIRRLFRYTPLPVHEYPEVVRNMHIFIKGWDHSPNDIDAWVQGVSQESRPRNRSEMKERMQQFRTKLKPMHRPPTPLGLHSRPVDIRNQAQVYNSSHSIPSDEGSQPLGLTCGYASTATNSSERSYSEYTGYSPNEGDLDDSRHPLTPNTQLSYHDPKFWQPLRSRPGSRQSNDDYQLEMSPPSTTRYHLLGATINKSVTEDRLFQANSRKFTTLDEWQGLRRTLSDEYSDGFVEDVHLLLDNLSYCSNFDHPSDNSKYHDPPYLVDYWQRLSEWRALPFEGSLLPSDFLHVDEHRHTFGTCLEGSQAHDDRVCLCAAPEDNLKNLWVTPRDLSPNAKIMLAKENITREDTETYDHFGNRLLHFLAARGPPETLFKVLEVVADIASLNFGGQTFLHCLGPDWFTGDLSPLHVLIRQLAQRGFDFSQRDSYGQTLFHICARRLDDWEVLLQLWSNSTISTCIRQRDAFGYQPSNIRTDEGGLYLPVPSLGKPERSPFEITLHPPGPNDGNTFGIFKDSTSCKVSVNHLLPHIAAIISGENPFDEDEKGQNALHRLATCTFQVDADRALSRYKHSLSSSALDENLKSGRIVESNSFCLDLKKVRHSLLSTFLLQGVDINAYNCFGNTVLMEFVIHFQYENGTEQPSSILEVLLQHGARVNARNRDGETALHLAAKHGRRAAMELLIEKGANIHVRNRKGQSPLQILREQIGGFEDNESEHRLLDDCYEWLSSQPVGCLLRPSILDECSSGNILLESAQPFPSVKEMINNILSRLQSREKGTELSPEAEIHQEEMLHRVSRDRGANPYALAASDIHDTGLMSETETESDNQSQASSTTESRTTITLVDELCDHITSNIFGVSISDLVQSEAVLQSVASCVDKISYLIEKEPQVTTHASGESHQLDQDLELPGHTHGSPLRPSKKRKFGDDNDSQDPSEPFENGPQRLDARNRGPSHAKMMKTHLFPCPYRRRNGSRFNCRDFRQCAWRPFQGLSQVKEHIKKYHMREELPSIVCPRCRSAFRTDHDLNNHLRELQPCQVSDADADINRLAMDPEDGIDSRIRDMLVDRKKGIQVIDWDALWRLLFSEDEEVLSPDYEPMIDFFEIERDFHRGNQEAKLLLQRIVTGDYQYHSGTQPAEELWNCLIGNVLKGCREDILATACQTTSGRRRSGATTTSSSSFAGPFGRFAPIMPTPASTTQRQPSSPALSPGTLNVFPTPPPIVRRVTAPEPSSDLVHSYQEDERVSGAPNGGPDANPALPMSEPPEAVHPDPVHADAYRSRAGSFPNIHITTYPMVSADHDIPNWHPHSDDMTNSLEAEVNVYEEEHNPFPWHMSHSEEFSLLGANFDATRELMPGDRE